MIRKYKNPEKLVKKYASDIIIDKSRLINNYREDVYNDFMRLNPGCGITSHYFTRHINKIFNTRIELVYDNKNLAYVFKDKGVFLEDVR